VGRPRKHDRELKLPKYVRILNGSYIYRGKKLCRVDEGESAMYEALANRKALTDVDTIPQAIAMFKASEGFRKLSPVSQKEHGRLLDIFGEEFEEFRVDQAKAHHIKKCITLHFKGKLTAARAFKSRVSTFFRFCISDLGLIEVNPCTEVWLDKPLSKKTPWTPALFWKMRDEFDPMTQCYHDLSYLLYQRTTDIRRLRREQIRDGIIHFAPSKTARSSGKEVDIQITPAIQAVLDRAESIAKEWALKKKRTIGPYIIQTRQGGAYTRSGMNSFYRRADEKLHGIEGLMHLNPKALRPFAATMAKKAGYTLEQLQVGLAHTTIGTTEGYIQTHEVPVSEVMMTLPDRPAGRADFVHRVRIVYTEVREAQMKTPASAGVFLELWSGREDLNLRPPAPHAGICCQSCQRLR
jgi:integrase